jgi:hypothetical protein
MLSIFQIDKFISIDPRFKIKSKDDSQKKKAGLEMLLDWIKSYLDDWDEGVLNAELLVSVVMQNVSWKRWARWELIERGGKWLT